jgi:putative transposase
VKGRKRHLLVDTQGLVLKATRCMRQTSWTLRESRYCCSGRTQSSLTLKHLWLESAYRGEDKGKDWVEKILGWSVEVVERPKKPASEEVLKSWAREWAKEGVQVDWEKLLPSMSKDYERLPATGEAFIYVAMRRLMARRLARS